MTLYLDSIMTLLDIHTHQLSSTSGKVIINCYPEDFSPCNNEIYSVGIHPWKAGNASDALFSKLSEYAHHEQVVAIGEAGIDKLTDTPLSIQIDVFKKQALLAETVKKPLIIHAVKAMDELVKLKREINPKQPWIIHGFRGKKEVADVFLKHGFYLSFGEYFHPKTVQSIPIERLFIESDESTLSIEEIYQKIADTRGEKIENLIENVKNNSCIFSMK